MHISNVYVCNKYLLNEYECLYTNIYEATWTHTFNLTNICCILTEYKLGLKSGGNHRFIFCSKELFKGGETCLPFFWQWFSKCSLWPAAVTSLGGLSEMQLFFTPPKTSWIRTRWMGVQTFMLLGVLQGSWMHVNVSEPLGCREALMC